MSAARTNVIETPIGKLHAISHKSELISLKFIDYDLNDNCQDTETGIERDIELYFKGKLDRFTASFKMVGTPFQLDVLSEVRKIEFGRTASYVDIAKAIGNEKAVRAVGNTNASNAIVLVIPCHRVIRINGSIGEYNGGAERKKWLLEHESRYKIQA